MFRVYIRFPFGFENHSIAFDRKLLQAHGVS